MNKIYFTLALFLLMAFGVFAQANTEPSVFPISLKYFEAKKNSQLNQNQLQWLAPCITSEATFEIQYSTDSRNFSTIHSITADQFRCTQPFIFLDAQQTQGNSYYRIKMTAGANQSINSFVVSVISKNNSFEINALLPSVVQANTILSISSPKNDAVQIMVVDVTGKKVLQVQQAILGGSNSIQFNFSKLSKGQYILSVTNRERIVKQVQFIKQ